MLIKNVNLKKKKRLYSVKVKTSVDNNFLFYLFILFAEEVLKKVLDEIENFEFENAFNLLK